MRPVVLRVAWLVASLCAVGLPACTGCSEPPVREGLKPEGTPCAADDECDTGLCEALPGAETLCRRKCAVGCHENEVCTPLSGARYACVPERAGLCETCDEDSDCSYPADRCISLGGQNFCGRDCSYDSVCPETFRCADASDLNGNLISGQCQPTSGTCECTSLSGGQQVPCEFSNSTGTCRGIKTCLPPAGYSECSAHVPAAEVCNGQDDDCNDQVDELLGDVTCGKGLCARTVAACANGQPQTCTPGVPEVEICDEKDNDCDGNVDEPFDKQSSLEHCGGCNVVCTLPHAEVACEGGECLLVGCEPGWTDLDKQRANGCEYPCEQTAGGVELCDGLDNDCDGDVDETFDLNVDKNNCGVCGKVCTAAFATTACLNKVCAIGQCNPGRADCNQQYPDGCEINTHEDMQHCGACGALCDPANATGDCYVGTCVIDACDPGWADCNKTAADGCEVHVSDDVLNCGGCGVVCSFANATPACASGTCAFTCLPGFVDLDQDPATGCEYACTFQSATDLPDLSFVDANCDGIDGEKSNGVFVAPAAVGGSDTNAGTAASPKASIAGGVAAAVATSKRDVYVAVGSYAEQVAPGKGIGVYGGYAPSTWARAVNNVVTVSGANPILRVESADGAAVQLMTLVGANATAAGATAYGGFIRDSSGVVLEGLTLKAGDGAPGISGASGSNGPSGGDGAAGESGCEDSDLICNSCVTPQVGLGGASACGRHGGSGGAPGHAGNFGSNGELGTGGTAAGLGTPPQQADWVAPPEHWGTQGVDGSNGGNGSSGSGFGTLGALGYVVAASSAGGDGVSGNGGGGGGGGGGGRTNCDSFGGAGSGGGAGGCGGEGGRRGTSGGASIGLYLWNASVNARASSIGSAVGGSGGNGGSGGIGGGGGSGAPPNVYGGIADQDDASNGGGGGAGGKGGSGGAGGAGGGGPTVGVVVGGGSSWNPVGTTLAIGTPGGGGSSPIGSGVTGLAQPTYP